MESEKAHLGGIIVRDLSCVVSNYRSQKTLDQYCKEQGVLGVFYQELKALGKLACKHVCCEVLLLQRAQQRSTVRRTIMQATLGSHGWYLDIGRFVHARVHPLELAYALLEPACNKRRRGCRHRQRGHARDHHAPA